MARCWWGTRASRISERMIRPRSEKRMLNWNGLWRHSLGICINKRSRGRISLLLFGGGESERFLLLLMNLTNHKFPIIRRFKKRNYQLWRQRVSSSFPFLGGFKKWLRVYDLRVSMLSQQWLNRNHWLPSKESIICRFYLVLMWMENISHSLCAQHFVNWLKNGFFTTKVFF